MWKLEEYAKKRMGRKKMEKGLLIRCMGENGKDIFRMGKTFWEGECRKGENGKVNVERGEWESEKGENGKVNVERGEWESD